MIAATNSKVFLLLNSDTVYYEYEKVFQLHMNKILYN